MIRNTARALPTVPVLSGGSPMGLGCRDHLFDHVQVVYTPARSAACRARYRPTAQQPENATLVAPTGPEPREEPSEAKLGS
jgi:hypothetical protein